MGVTILGGGVSGLSLAFYLSKKLSPSNISLWEATNRTGGWLKSHRTERNILFEQAARTLRPRSESGANTLSLIEELKLTDDVLPIMSNSSAAKTRMIFADGKLHVLPSSLLSLFKRMPPFSKPLILSIMNEYRVPRVRLKDESIYDFINRRFGPEFADYLISPLICGICAGDAKRISVHFLAEQLFKYEQTYGSVTKGIIYNLFSKGSDTPTSSLLDKCKQEKWSVYSFKDGIETLPKKLNEVVISKGVTIKLDAKCDKIEFTKDGVRIHSKGNSVETSHLFSTILSEQLAFLLEDQHPTLAKMLSEIKSINVAIVNLHFEGNIIKYPGFGFLIPPKENIPILGVIYDSCCFDQNGDTVLTVMMGGHWFDKYFKSFSNENQFYDIALKNVKAVLKIGNNPISHKVTILDKCIPQYMVGHKENVGRIKSYIKSNNLPISICGMSFHGVGVNDVILSAKKLAESFINVQK